MEVLGDVNVRVAGTAENFGAQGCQDVPMPATPIGGKSLLAMKRIKVKQEAAIVTPTGAKRKHGDITPDYDALTNLVLLFGELAIDGVVHCLPASGALALQTVNRPWRDLMEKYEDDLFEKFLSDDFVEGDVLADIVKGQAGYSMMSYKKMYLAFEHRFRLPKEKEHVCFHYDKPKKWDPLYSAWTSYADHFVFISRVGQHCAEMKWTSKNEEGSTVYELNLKSPSDFGFTLQREEIESLARNERKALLPLSLVCIDMNRCKAISIMEDEVPAQFSYRIPGEQDSDGEDEDEEGEAGEENRIRTSGHGLWYGKPNNDDSPLLFGIPQQKPLKVDWDSGKGFYTNILNQPEDYSFFACEGLMQLTSTKNDAALFRVKNSKGVSFSFDAIRAITNRNGICSFLRTAMEGKCK